MIRRAEGRRDYGVIFLELSFLESRMLLGAIAALLIDLGCDWYLADDDCTIECALEMEETLLLPKMLLLGTLLNGFNLLSS